MRLYQGEGELTLSGLGLLRILRFSFGGERLREFRPKPSLKYTHAKSCDKGTVSLQLVSVKRRGGGAGRGRTEADGVFSL